MALHDAARDDPVQQRLAIAQATEILGDDHAVPGALVGEVSPRLLYSLATWRRVENSDNAQGWFAALVPTTAFESVSARIGVTQGGVESGFQGGGGRGRLAIQRHAPEPSPFRASVYL